MKSIKTTVTGLAAVALACFALASHAAPNAYCEVKKDGEKAKKATGNCTVLEEGDSVSIKLANGEHFDMRQKGKKNHFKDQKGRGVNRNVKGDGSHVYNWEHRKITVHFSGVEAKKK